MRPSGSSTTDKLVALKSSFNDLDKSQLIPYNLFIWKFLLKLVLIGIKLLGSLSLKVFSEYKRFTSTLKFKTVGNKLKLISLKRAQFLDLTALLNGVINLAGALKL